MALISPNAQPARARAASPAIDISPSALDPITNPSVAIPAGRIAAAVGDLDQIIREVLSAIGVPGLAAAVVHRGELFYANGLGVRNRKAEA